jgi:hypothetical protein
LPYPVSVEPPVRDCAIWDSRYPTRLAPQSIRKSPAKIFSPLDGFHPVFALVLVSGNVTLEAEDAAASFNF